MGWNSNSGFVERWADLGYILKVIPTGFADGLHVGVIQMEELSLIPRLLPEKLGEQWCRLGKDEWRNG